VIIEAFNCSCIGLGQGLFAILAPIFNVDDFMSSKKLEPYNNA
jgi:hypothetical protein